MFRDIILSGISWNRSLKLNFVGDLSSMCSWSPNLIHQIPHPFSDQLIAAIATRAAVDKLATLNAAGKVLSASSILTALLLGHSDTDLESIIGVGVFVQGSRSCGNLVNIILILQVQTWDLSQKASPYSSSHLAVAIIMASLDSPREQTADSPANVGAIQSSLALGR